MATVKSSSTTGVPVMAGLPGGVTVNVTFGRFGEGRPPRGEMKRSSSDGASYLDAIPAKSPVGEWHVAHLPSPLKYAAPALASPVSKSCVWKVGELRSVS